MRCTHCLCFVIINQRREYQGISLATSPTNHTPPRYYTDCPTIPEVYTASHYHTDTGQIVLPRLFVSRPPRCIEDLRRSVEIAVEVACVMESVEHWDSYCSWHTVPRCTADPVTTAHRGSSVHTTSSSRCITVVQDSTHAHHNDNDRFTIRQSYYLSLYST